MIVLIGGPHAGREFTNLPPCPLIVGVERGGQTAVYLPSVDGTLRHHPDGLRDARPVNPPDWYPTR